MSFGAAFLKKIGAQRAPAENDIGTVRCGRCSEILPDETSSYCLKCGVPFSRVPPTETFTTLTERREFRFRRREQSRQALLGTIAATAFFCMWGLVREIGGELSIRRTPAVRKIELYTYNVPEFPSLSPVARRQGIAIALQSFEDHFGVALRDVTILEDRLPPELKERFKGPWSPQQVNGDSPMLLSVWERDLYPKFFSKWKSDPSQPLHVLVTNIPLLATAEDGSDLELSHLSSSGLVSGLGHPSFVVTSTYRLMTQQDEFRRHHAPLDTDTEKARYLGEYVIAHELGHALLGLTDYVVDPEFPFLRDPASLAEQENPLEAKCLMHSDKGGGFLAWKALSKRPLGERSPCHAYDEVLQAFTLRTQSLAEHNSGRTFEARRLHRQAMEHAEGQAQDWVLEQWRTEQNWFDGFLSSIF